MKLLTNYAFNKLGLKEINLGVISENTAAIKLYKKCGFRVKGIERKALNHGGVSYDNIRMVRKRM